VTDPCAIPLSHGVIGNGRVLALVSPTTRIDWLCMPRFDSALVDCFPKTSSRGPACSSAIFLRPYTRGID
jgi:hypothetical protein